MNLDAIATDETSVDADATIGGYTIREPRDREAIGSKHVVEP